MYLYFRRSSTRNHYLPTIPINVRFYVTEWYGLFSQLFHSKYNITIRPYLHGFSHNILRDTTTKMWFVSGKMKIYFTQYLLRMRINTLTLAWQVRMGNTLWIQNNLYIAFVHIHVEQCCVFFFFFLIILCMNFMSSKFNYLSPLPSFPIFPTLSSILPSLPHLPTSE